VVMFLERIVASCSFCSVPSAVRYVTLTASYLPDNELQGKGGWLEPGPAGKTFLYVSVNHFNSCFHSVEYTVHHVFDPLQCFILLLAHRYL
jgi:hypothetical protein